MKDLTLISLITMCNWTQYSITTKTWCLTVDTDCFGHFSPLKDYNLMTGNGGIYMKITADIMVIIICEKLEILCIPMIDRNIITPRKLLRRYEVQPNKGGVYRLML